MAPLHLVTCCCSIEGRVTTVQIPPTKIPGVWKEDSESGPCSSRLSVFFDSTHNPECEGPSSQLGGNAGRCRLRSLPFLLRPGDHNAIGRRQSWSFRILTTVVSPRAAPIWSFSPAHSLPVSLPAPRPTGMLTYSIWILAVLVIQSQNKTSTDSKTAIRHSRQSLVQPPMMSSHQHLARRVSS